VIEFLIRSSNEDLGVIKFKNERRQKDTRLEEEARRVERYEEIQTESMNSNKKNVAMEQKWTELKDYEECEELNKVAVNLNMFVDDRRVKSSVCEDH
jgi:dynein regulatory complex protein 1